MFSDLRALYMVEMHVYSCSSKVWAAELLLSFHHRVLNSLPHNPDPEREAFWKHCRKRIKCW